MQAVGGGRGRGCKLGAPCFAAAAAAAACTAAAALELEYVGPEIKVKIELEASSCCGALLRATELCCECELIGPLQLDTLKPGEWRRAKPSELKLLRQFLAQNTVDSDDE